MLTEERVLLVGNSQQIERFLFEAIEPIVELSQVEEVWSYNKTPIIMNEFYNSEIEAKKMTDTKILFVPEELNDSDEFIKFCHVNRFECGETIKTQKFDTRKDECFLCRIGNHTESMEKFNKTTKRKSDLIIYESDNFFVKVELGCLIPGMLMVNPKQHHYSAARLPTEQFEEYFEVLADTELILKKTYGDLPVIFFEHGSAPTGFSSHAKSIVHAHTHVAIGCKFDEKYLDMVHLRPINHIAELYKSKYLSYQCGTDGQLLAVNDPRVYVQRQYPRQVIGLMNGIPNALTNWRIEPFEENMKSTFNDILRSLRADDYCQRIVQRTKGFVEGYPMREDFE